METGHTTRTPVRRAVALLVCAWGLASSASALQGRLVADGFVEPVFLTAPPNDRRAFVVQKGGVIVVVQPNGSRGTYLDISGDVATDAASGLLGMAFDPAFSTTRRFYVYYIDVVTRESVVARYRAANVNSPSVDPATREVIIRVPQGPFFDHKAGWIGFRPGDRRNLYIALGDGGSANDPFNNAQNPQVLLGKLLRLDVSGSGPGYRIAASNPFAGSTTTRPEIWALGMRNPWRNSFDRATGDFWISDVGQDAYEELNREAASDPGGRNYGWRLREGPIPTPGVGGDAPGLTGPVFSYPHSGPSTLGRSLTGGYIYRGPSVPDANGRYFFADYVANRVYSFAPGPGGVATDLREDTPALLGGIGLNGIVSFGEDGRGGLYVIGIDGKIVALCGNTPAPVGPCAAPPAQR